MTALSESVAEQAEIAPGEHAAERADCAKLAR